MSTFSSPSLTATTVIVADVPDSYSIVSAWPTSVNSTRTPLVAHLDPFCGATRVIHHDDRVRFPIGIEAHPCIRFRRLATAFGEHVPILVLLGWDRLRREADVAIRLDRHIVGLVRERFLKLVRSIGVDIDGDT